MHAKVTDGPGQEAVSATPVTQTRHSTGMVTANAARGEPSLCSPACGDALPHSSQGWSPTSGGHSGPLMWPGSCVP